MIACRARQAASYNADESFTYYVDPSGGLDANPGTKASPFLTLAHGLATATTKQSIGVKRGTTTRNGSLLTSSVADLRIGAYGAGAKPIISGGTVVTGWTGATPTLGSEMLTNPGLETATSPPTGWTIDSGAPTQTTSPVHSGTYAAQFTNGSGRLAQNVTLTGGQQYQFSFWYQENTAGKSVGFGLDITSGTSSGNQINASGAVVSGTGVFPVTVSVNVWAQAVITFTMPATGTMAVKISAYDGGTYVGTVDDVSLKPVTGASGPTYSAALTSAPAFVTSATTGLTLGSSASALTTNQFFWAGNVLSVNLGGTNPSGVTVEASTSVPLKFQTAGQIVVLRGVDVRFGYDQALYLTGISTFIVDRCNFQWTAFVVNSGTLLAQNCTGSGRLAGSTFTQLQNDGVWVHNSPNVQIDHNTMTSIGALAGDVQSDGIQMEDTFNSGLNSSGLWIHHNTITMGSASPKGGIIVNADPALAMSSAIVENNTCNGGNYGVAAHANNMTVRYNSMLSQVSAFGGGVHIDSSLVLDNIQVHHNLIVGSTRAGIIVQDTASNRTNLLIANNTIVNAAWVPIYIGGPASGQIANNVAWWTVQPTNLEMVLAGVASGESLAIDYNDLGTAFANYLKNVGTTYSTLAAWRAATGYDAHSISADPLFTNPGTGDYSLQSGSPAKGVGGAVTALGIAAGGNLGAY